MYNTYTQKKQKNERCFDNKHKRPRHSCEVLLLAGVLVVCLCRWRAISSVISDLIKSFHHGVALFSKK